jgi:thiol:disulfide interchange protein DsbD
MKKFWGLLAFLFLWASGIGAHAQILDPVKWSYSTEYVDDSEVWIIWSATMDDHWHLYSQDIPEGGPIATAFYINESDDFELIGSVEEGEAILEYDPNFMMDLKYFDHEAEFRQRVKVLSSKKFVISGELEFMTCDATQCLPPDLREFEFEIKGNPSAEAGTEPQEESTKPDKVEGTDGGQVVEVDPGKAFEQAEGERIPDEISGSSTGIEESNEGAAKEKTRKSLWATFLLSFLGGFAALLTPCVFPMIPMTVSFFTKQSKSRSKGITNGIIYGLSIIFMYVVLGFAVTKAFGPDALNALSTNVWFNIIFFLLLVVFAISFFGAFEIVLPSSWVNAADKNAERGGIIGIFFMAFTLALVSFSCTGPIIGTALVEAAVHGGTAGPLVAMFGFSLALAFPFAFFAAFPGYLNSLPKSGGWLNSVKVVLGFLELALAFKFLSNADLVTQSHLLEREVFLAIWIVIFGLMGLYLLGKLRLPHDSPMDYISVPRLLMGIVVMSFVVYMIPGLWGAPLKLISGFPPPMQYSESPTGFGGGRGVAAAKEHGPEGTHLGPQGIPTFHEFDLARDYARKVGKPLMVDFTGHACVNCRKMEDGVWSDARVKEIMTNDIVLVSLYVDEKTPLPEEEQYVSETTGKKIRTVGNKWSDFQAKVYGTNSQPYYIILDDEGYDPLNGSAAYDPNIQLFIDWLTEGINAYHE